MIKEVLAIDNFNKSLCINKSKIFWYRNANINEYLEISSTIRLKENINPTSLFSDNLFVKGLLGMTAEDNDAIFIFFHKFITLH